jgi:hypothetical protein
MFGQRIETVCPKCEKAYSSMLEWLRKLPYVCPDCKTECRLGSPETVVKNQRLYANLVETK